MDETVWIVVVALVAVVVTVGIWAIIRYRQRERLRSRFGPEYDATVRKYGSVSRAEEDLAARQRRVEHFEIRPLGMAEADRFAAAWRQTQALFVDEPRAAIADAERLVQEVMAARGYPVGEDFEQRAADVSVDHPAVVRHYRVARRIAVASARGTADTEDLRQAMMHYRVLFEDLLEVRNEGPRRMEAGR